MQFDFIRKFLEELRLKFLIKKVRRELLFYGLSTDHYTDEELLAGSRSMIHMLGQAGLTSQQVADTLGSVMTLGMYGISDYKEKADE